MELIYEAEASAAVERNLRDVEGFAARLEVLPYDNEAAAHTGQLRAELRKIGRPIGPYDEMIAGHARSQVLIVVTHNIKQFENVPGIRPHPQLGHFRWPLTEGFRENGLGEFVAAGQGVADLLFDRVCVSEEFGS